MFEERDIICHKLEEVAEQVFIAIGLDLDDFCLTNDQIRGIAPCHEEADNPTAFCYYHDSGRWFCFSNGCQKEYGPDLIGLIRAVKKCNYQEALDVAKGILDNKIDEIEIPLSMIAKRMKVSDPFRSHLCQEVFDDEMLKRLRPGNVFAQQRGLDYSILSSMGCGVAEKGYLKGRFVIPVRNLKGQVVGFTARKIKESLWGPKWLHHPNTFRKNINLFNISRAYNDIQKTKSIIIVEGPFDVIKLEMAGFYNVIALLGTTMSEDQIGLLGKMGVEKVILGLDNDEPGQEAMKKIADKLAKRFYDQIIIAPQGANNDWGEMEIKEIRDTFSGVELGK